MPALGMLNAAHYTEFQKKSTRDVGGVIDAPAPSQASLKYDLPASKVVIKRDWRSSCPRRLGSPRLARQGASAPLLPIGNKNVGVALFRGVAIGAKYDLLAVG